MAGTRLTFGSNVVRLDRDHSNSGFDQNEDLIFDYVPNDHWGSNQQALDDFSVVGVKTLQRSGITEIEPNSPIPNV